ncbi:MAG: hypothetical protein HAW67_04170 [Endozoicomonadaceae bacterium]|nr:hypothetical protein [Endozoicomonadaceae bacterium]
MKNRLDTMIQLLGKSYPQVGKRESPVERLEWANRLDALETNLLLINALGGGRLLDNNNRVPPTALESDIIDIGELDVIIALSKYVIVDACANPEILDDINWKLKEQFVRLFNYKRQISTSHVERYTLIHLLQKCHDEAHVISKPVSANISEELDMLIKLHIRYSFPFSFKIANDDLLGQVNIQNEIKKDPILLTSLITYLLSHRRFKEVVYFANLLVTFDGYEQISNSILNKYGAYGISR